MISFAISAFAKFVSKCCRSLKSQSIMSRIYIINVMWWANLKCLNLLNNNYSICSNCIGSLLCHGHCRNVCGARKLKIVIRNAMNVINIIVWNASSLKWNRICSANLGITFIKWRMSSWIRLSRATQKLNNAANAALHPIRTKPKYSLKMMDAVCLSAMPASHTCINIILMPSSKRYH